MKNLEILAEEIADNVVIAYTKATVLSPEEAFRLNNIIFEIARHVLEQKNNKTKESNE